MSNPARNRQIYEAAARRLQYHGVCQHCTGAIHTTGYHAYHALSSIKRHGYACCSVSCGKSMAWKRKKEATNE